MLALPALSAGSVVPPPQKPVRRALPGPGAARWGVTALTSFLQ